MSLRAFAKQSPLFSHREGQSPVVISSLSLEDLGYLEGKKKMDKNEEVPDEESIKKSSKNDGGERRK